MENLITKTLDRIEKREEILLSHNVYPYYKAAKAFQEGQNRVALVHAVGTGKSFIALQWLHDELTGAVVSAPNETEKPLKIHAQKQVRVLYLAPKKAAFGQIQRHIDDVGVTALHEKIEYMTYSALLSKFKKSKGDFELEDIEDFELTEEEYTEFEQYISQFTHIVLDEFHHADENKWGYAVSRALEANKTAKVLGLTATPIRSTGTNTVDTIFAGNVVSTISLADAIIQGILPFPIYQTAIYSYDKIIEKYTERINKIKDESKRIEATKDIEDIKEMITKAKNSQDLIISNLLSKRDGKFIIFCSSINASEQYMKDIIEMLELNGADIQAVYNVNSSIPDAQESIDEFSKLQGKGLKLLFAVDMLNESVHIKDIDGVIMLRDTESFIVYSQQLGRALSAGKDKNPLVLDLVDNIDSSFDYQADRKGIMDLFREVAERTQDEKVRNLALQAIRENEIMTKLRSLDEKIGVTVVPNGLKLEILKDMKKNGIDLNKLKDYAKSHEFYIYDGVKYGTKTIQKWIRRAKEKANNYTQDFLDELVLMGVDLSTREILSVEEKLALVSRAISMVPLPEGIYKEDGKFIIVGTFEFEGQKIGQWLRNIEYGHISDEKLISGLESLNVGVKTQLSVQQKLEIFKKAISMDPLPENIVKRDGKFVVYSDCVFEGHRLGNFINAIKSSKNPNKKLVEGLNKLNIDLTKRLSTEEKLELIKRAINTKPLPEGIMLTDGKYCFSNKVEFEGENIGVMVKTVKYSENPDKKMVEGLKKLKVDYNASLKTVQASEKAKIIDRAIKTKPLPKGIVLEDGKYKIADWCEFEGYGIGGWLEYARKKNQVDDFGKELEAINVSLIAPKLSIPSGNKLEVIKRAIETRPLLEGIELIDGTYYIPYKFEFEGMNIGDMIYRVDNDLIKDSSFVEAIKNLNIKYKATKERKYFSYPEKLEIITRALKEKPLPDGIELKKGKYRISSRCVFEGLKIGMWIENFKSMEKRNEDFEKGLVSLNIDLGSVLLSAKEKLKIIEKAINTKPLPKGIKVIDEMYRISPLCEFEDESIGVWIVSIRHDLVNDEEFKQGLIKLKIDFSKKMSAEEQIEIIKKAIESDAEGIKIVDGKHVIPRSCVFEKYNIGNWVNNIKIGKTKNQKFKEALIKMGVSLPEDVVSSESQSEV